MLVLQQELRETLGKPFGVLFFGDSLWKSPLLSRYNVVTVGDMVTRGYIRALGKPPPLAFIDLKTKRASYEHAEVLEAFANVVRINNPPATLNIEDILETISEAIVGFPEETVLVVVEGEEDLIPLVLAYLPLPVGTLVIYGQPDAGVVAYRLEHIYVIKTAGIVSSMKQLLHLS